MSCDFIQLANPGIQQLRPYEPGKPIEELQRELGLTEVVKLASNENPKGPGPAVTEAMARAAREINRYPDGNGFLLKQAIAERITQAQGITPESIVLGNGSSDLLDFAARVFLQPGSDAIISQHAFAIYDIVIRAAGANPVVAPAKNWGHDLDAMAAAITPNTRLVYVTNPNNPTGTWLSKSALRAFLDQIPEHIIVVLDEAYFEYVTEPEYPNGLELLADYPNLIVTRTFSKAYGLSGLRIGYGVMNPQVADLLNRVRPPFNTTNISLAAAEAALADQAYLEQSRQLNAQGMAQLTEYFEQQGLAYIPSVANFVTVQMPAGVSALDVNNALLRAGVIVRPIGGYQMPDHLRVSIGLPEENQFFINSLNGILARD